MKIHLKIKFSNIFLHSFTIYVCIYVCIILNDDFYKMQYSLIKNTRRK